MTRVVAIILHTLSGGGSGPLEAAFAAARAANAARQARGFENAGAASRVIETTPGGSSFGKRLREVAAGAGGRGLVVLGSGSVPLATPADRRRFVDAAATRGGPVLANNRFSADIVALPPGLRLDDLPDVVADNGLPRWFADRGTGIADLHGRWRLQVDLDSPLDVRLCGLGRSAAAAHSIPDDSRVRAVAARVLAAASDPAAELLVAGRSSSSTLRWLEHNNAARTRALIEERGMRTARPGQRAVRSTIGLLLDRDGPESLGAHVAELSDAAVIDTRVLLAHRLGTDETGWPQAEDRFGSDLLLHERIADPWLRALTRAAVEAPVPILLGGHTLVGPGLRLIGNLVA